MPFFFVSAAQSIRLDYLTLVASSTYIFESHGTVTNEETVLGWLPQGIAHSRLKQTPSLSVKEAYLIVLELQQEGQTSSLDTSRGLLRPVDTIFALFLCVTPGHWRLPERCLTLIWCPDLCNDCLGDTSGLASSGGQWNRLLWSHSIVYIHIF